MSLIAVDMTPVFPNGRNGGAKIFALELLKSFQTMSPEHNFLILTASWNHQELSILDNIKMRRVCIISSQDSPGNRPASFFSGRMHRKLRQISRNLRKRIPYKLSGKSQLKSMGVDLLFCPFTAPTYAEPGIPVVSVILDLQHLVYPQFFTPGELHARQLFFDDLQKKADMVVCISESVRASVLKNFNMDSKKTLVAPICIHSRLLKQAPELVKADILALGIHQRPYLFYPANFWPHKNHKMLLTAFGMFSAKNPDKNIDLVLTGALDDMEAKLKTTAHQMGLKDRIHFLGYLPDNQLSSVWQGCELLVFPSLYEGFGIPVLEAMYYGKAVICSNTSSLPEIAREAALYFDPRNPKEIVQ